MKRTCLFLLTFVSTLFLEASVYAVPPRGAFQQASSDIAAKSRSEHPPEVQAAGRPEHKAPIKNHPNDEREALAGRVHGPTHPGRSVPSRTPQILKTGPVTSARSTGLRRQRLNTSDDLAREGLIRSGARRHALPAPARTAVRPAMPLLTAVQHRGTNSAAIGGPPNSASSATINGTSMKRKP